MLYGDRRDEQLYYTTEMQLGIEYLPKRERGIVTKHGLPLPRIGGSLEYPANGYMVMPFDELPFNLANNIFEVQSSFRAIQYVNNVMVTRQLQIKRQLNWNGQVARRFACDCIRHIHPIWENKYPNDRKILDALCVIMRYANGEVIDAEIEKTRDEMECLSRRFTYDNLLYLIPYAAMWAASTRHPSYHASMVAKLCMDVASFCVDKPDAPQRSSDDEHDWQCHRLRLIL